MLDLLITPFIVHLLQVGERWLNRMIVAWAKEEDMGADIGWAHACLLSMCTFHLGAIKPIAGYCR